MYKRCINCRPTNPPPVKVHHYRDRRILVPLSNPLHTGLVNHYSYLLDVFPCLLAKVLKHQQLQRVVNESILQSMKKHRHRKHKEADKRQQNSALIITLSLRFAQYKAHQPRLLPPPFTLRTIANGWLLVFYHAVGFIFTQELISALQKTRPSIIYTSWHSPLVSIVHFSKNFNPR